MLKWGFERDCLEWQSPNLQPETCLMACFRLLLAKVIFFCGNKANPSLSASTIRIFCFPPCKRTIMAMDEQFRQIAEYINQHLNQGQTEEDIRNYLLQNGWTQDQTEKAFFAARSINPDPIGLALQSTDNSSVSNERPLEHAQAPTDMMQPKKYRVFRAIQETFSAIKVNMKAVAAALLIPILISVAVVVILGFIITTTTMFTRTEGVSSLVALTLTVLWQVVGVAIMTAVYTSMLGLAINDGAEGRKGQIKSLLRLAIQRVRRVFLGTLLLNLYIALPILLVIIVIFGLLLQPESLNGFAGLGLGLAAMFFIQLIALIWTLIIVLRYSLIPFIALFEPDIPLRQLRKRSKHLLIKGGQWFLIKGFLLLLIVFILIGVLAGESMEELLSSSNPLTIGTLLIILLGLLANGAMVVLYRNRKVIRG